MNTVKTNVITKTIQTLDSREVAKMVEKEHKNLVRDIRRYIIQLGESNIGLSDCNNGKISFVDVNKLNIAPVEFFKESKYTDAKGETRPCYFITKKGCEFIAHKLTGTKGTAFISRYINWFHEMENKINSEIYSYDKLQQIENIIENVKQQTFDGVKIHIKPMTEIFGALLNSVLHIQQDVTELKSLLSGIQKRQDCHSKNSKWFSYMLPKYQMLMKNFNIHTNEELYYQLFFKFENDYSVSLNRIIKDYCKENKLICCDKLKVIQNNLHMRILFEEMVDKLLIENGIIKTTTD